MENYEIDRLDRQILQELRKDARTPYTDIAKKLVVSGGTIHQRMAKLTESGIVEGSSIKINSQKLGLDVTVILGIHLKTAKDARTMIDKLKKIKNVTEIYYTTGNYALIIKVVTKTIRDYHILLTEKLQNLAEIQSTESFICLETPLLRDAPIDLNDE